MIGDGDYDGGGGFIRGNILAGPPTPGVFRFREGTDQGIPIGIGLKGKSLKARFQGVTAVMDLDGEGIPFDKGRSQVNMNLVIGLGKG